MIFILSGPVHSGKTSWLSQAITELKRRGLCCKGILTYAVFKKGGRIGYDIVDIATERRLPFIRLVGYDNGFEGSDVYLRNYHFSSVAIEEGNKILKGALKADITVVDEVGPLELQRRGFFTAIDFLMTHKPPCLILVVRDSIVSGVTELFGIDEYLPITTEQNDSLKQICKTIKESEWIDD